jgi:hypothetical protein
VAAGEGVTLFPTGIGFPHLGHLTSVGIRPGCALIFNFALQLPHSMGIKSILLSFMPQRCSYLTHESSNEEAIKQSYFERKHFGDCRLKN